jgi:hypothetical protein
MTKQRARTSPPKPTPSAASLPAEVYGPHLPPNTRMVNGRLVGIPPVACSGDEAKARMAAANAKPISPACFEVERWASRGGSAGLSCNGYLLSGKKPG